MTSYFLGIEWSDSAVRVACFRRSRSSFRLTLLERVEFPVAEQSARVGIFKQWLHERFPADAVFEVALSVPESHIILKELELPNLPEKELDEALQWELSGRSSVVIPQSSIQYQVIEKAGGTVKIASMIMKNHEVAGYLSFFKNAGVKLIAIEPSSVSLGRILEIPKDSSVLLTLEGSEANLIFLRNANPVFSTAISLPMSSTSAKNRRFSKESAAQLVSQLKRTISYWETKENRHIDTIIVATEAATFTGLRSVTAHAFDIPVTPATIKKEVLVKATKFSSTVLARYMIAIGAGDRLRGSESGQVANFLPAGEVAILEKELLTSVIARNLYRFAMLNAIVSCILLVVIGYLGFRRFANANDMAQTTRFVANHPAQQFVAEINKVNALIVQANDLSAHQQDIGARLKYFGTSTPQKLALTTVKMANATAQEWSIEGTGDRADILAFYYKLQATAGAKTVSMPYSNFNKEKGATFKITIVW